MKAVILAGGFGTRLRPLTCETPKPMVPVMNRPLLEHTLNLLTSYNCTEVICLLYYLPERFTNYFGDGSSFGVNITYILAAEDYGTAGAVKQAQHLLNENFFVLSGDALTDLNLDKFRQFHSKKKGIASLALASVSNPSPFGVALTDENERITRFLEKPSGGQVFSDTVNAGIYILEPEVFDYIEKQKESYFARDIFPGFLKLNKAIFGYSEQYYWRDIGDLQIYQQVHTDVLNGKIKLNINGDYQRETSSLLGQNCTVHQQARLKGCTIGNNCKIEADAELNDVILWDNAVVHQGCKIKKSVIGLNSIIGANTYIEDDVYISDNIQIGKNCHVNSNVKIWPSKIIEDSSTVNNSLVWVERWRRELFIDSRVAGLANLEITPEFAAKLGAAFGAWLGGDCKVLMSRDASSVARMIYRSLIAGLMSSGVNISTIQVMPLPIVRFMLRSGPEKGGLYIRRSAKDSNLVEILFFDGNGRDLTSGATKAIERIYFREDFPRVGIDEIGKISYPVRAVESYEQYFIEHVDVAAFDKGDFRIVVDYSYGAALQVFPSILSNLHCDVLALNANPDPRKFHQTPRDIERALKSLAKIVKSTGAHAGFMFDKGAERIRAVDDQGRIISDDRFSIFVTRLVLDVAPKVKIAMPVSAPAQVEAVARKKGCAVVKTAYDSSAIIKATEDEDVGFVLTARGGFIFSNFHFAYDAMYTLIKVMEYVAKDNLSLARLHDEIAMRHYKQTTAPCSWDMKGEVMRKLTTYTANKPRIMIDGVKVLLDDAWALVLPDRDKEFCHVIAEADSEKRVDEIINQYVGLVKMWSSL